jgi:hypothetical protein
MRSDERLFRPSGFIRRDLAHFDAVQTWSSHYDRWRAADPTSPLGPLCRWSQLVIGPTLSLAPPCHWRHLVIARSVSDAASPMIVCTVRLAIAPCDDRERVSQRVSDPNENRWKPNVNVNTGLKPCRDIPGHDAREHLANDNPDNRERGQPPARQSRIPARCRPDVTLWMPAEYFLRPLVLLRRPLHGRVRLRSGIIHCESVLLQQIEHIEEGL